MHYKLNKIYSYEDGNEYIIYYGGKIAAYICDDRLLVKHFFEKGADAGRCCKG